MHSSCGAPRRPRPRCLPYRRQQQVGGNAEAGAHALHHTHAQFLFPRENFADAARRAQDRGHVGAGKAVFVHEMADQIGRARRPARPSALLIALDLGRSLALCRIDGWHSE